MHISVIGRDVWDQGTGEEAVSNQHVCVIVSQLPQNAAHDKIYYNIARLHRHEHFKPKFRTFIECASPLL